MSSEVQTEVGWRLGRSIAVELDVATYYVRLGADALPKSLSELVLTIPPNWFEEFDALTLEEGETRLMSIIELLARWAGVVDDDDYDTASAAMRELTVDSATDNMSASTGLLAASDLDGVERLADLNERAVQQMWSPFGLTDTPPSEDTDAVTAAIGALVGQPNHGRFWHWLDRFYYEAYGPWRTTREGMMDAADERAIAGLGSASGTGAPNLEWLPDMNPLLKKQPLEDAVQAGDLNVIFWTEPFGLADTWSLFPGTLLTSTAEQGHLYEHYHAARDDLAKRLSALADSTRLRILRMIQMHDLDNTQIANCMDVSRPTISVHAKVLAEAGLISTRREGRQAVHKAEPDAIKNLFEELSAFLDVVE
jgi:DNA-binding transcriptional ArsR family regulator